MESCGGDASKIYCKHICKYHDYLPVEMLYDNI
jgi:hypothetical protein